MNKNELKSKYEKYTDQNELLNIQKTLAPESRLADRITVIGFVIIICFFSLFTMIYPDAEFSEQENRVLHQKPKLTLTTLTNGQFTSEISAYFKDQFPLRNQYVGLKSTAEILMRKQQVNGVLLGDEGNLITRKDYPETIGLERNIHDYILFAEAMEQRGIPCSFAAAGRSMDVLTQYTPSLYTDEFSKKIWACFDSMITEKGKSYIDLLTPLKTAAENGEYVYYKTDHHWTTYGAYLAYCEIMESLGETPQSADVFTVEKASGEFYGTTWSTAGIKWIAPDTMEYYRYEGDMDYTVEIMDDGSIINGFYDRSYLQVKDKYSSFIGGNNAYVRITKDNPEGQREKLLVIKDSYAHSVIPFLAYHYDLEVLDLRYYRESPAKLVEETGVDRVLFLFNMDNITGASPVLTALGLGLKEETGLS